MSHDCRLSLFEPYWGVPATGNHVKWNAIMTYRFVDGKVAEQWAAEDWVAILHGVDFFTPSWLAQD